VKAIMKMVSVLGFIWSERQLLWANQSWLEDGSLETRCSHVPVYYILWFMAQCLLVCLYRFLWN